MAIRRNDPRRRRVGVLLDDPGKVAEVATAASSARPSSKKPQSEKPVTAYRVRHLTKTSDLIPTRFLSCCLVVLVVVFGVAIINWLYLYATQMTEVVGVRALETFSLTGRGSLSHWFTTSLLIFSGMASLQIYALRQHRSDDYRGTYRLWLWLALLFLFASVDAAVGLHDLAIHAYSYFTGRSLSHGGWALVTIKLVALTALVVRGVYEVRQSKGALIAVLFVWFAYAGAILIQLPQAQSGTVLEYEAVYGNLYLFGTVALFHSLMFYARFVFMSVQGLIVAKPEVKTKAVAKAKAKSKSKSQANSKANSDSASQAKTKTKAELKAEAKATAKAEAKAAAAAKAEAKAQAKEQAQLAAQARANEQAQAKAKEQAKSKSQAKAKAQAQAKAKAEIQAKAKAKAEANARAKAQIEAKARAKAEIEAKARAKAEVHAKQKAAKVAESSSGSDEPTLPLSGKLNKRQLRKQRKAERNRRAA